MNIWYIHLLVCNLNWIITSFFHLFTLIYNITVYLNHSSDDETLSLKLSAISIKAFVCIVYIFMNYFSDYQKKLNYCIRTTLHHVS